MGKEVRVGSGLLGIVPRTSGRTGHSYNGKGPYRLAPVRTLKPVSATLSLRNKDDLNDLIILIRSSRSPWRRFNPFLRLVLISVCLISVCLDSPPIPPPSNPTLKTVGKFADLG